MLVPLVSIVIAVKNSVKYIKETLDSIENQSFRDFEVVIIDGHSSDQTKEIAVSYSFTKIYSQKGDGFAGAWNQGIAIAQGDLIAFVDSDDKWPINKLALQVTYLNEHPESEGVIGKANFFIEPDQEMPKTFNPLLLESDYVAPMPGALMVRKPLFEKIGVFETKFKITSDIAWFAKVKDNNISIGVIDEVLLEKRVHKYKLSYNKSTQIKDNYIVKLIL